jgi:nucleotide-binding universal stress UspA family protein
MSSLLDRVLLPVANPSDAAATAAAAADHLTGDVVALNVIEKAGGAPDKAGVSQRKLTAEAAFDVLRKRLDADVETEIRYGTDIAETIIAAAADHDVTAIVFTPRQDSRWRRLLTGDVALSLVTTTDRPVVTLPVPDPADVPAVDEPSGEDETQPPASGEE